MSNTRSSKQLNKTRFKKLRRREDTLNRHLSVSNFVDVKW